MFVDHHLYALIWGKYIIIMFFFDYFLFFGIILIHFVFMKMQVS